MKKDIPNRRPMYAGPYSFYPNEPRRLQMDIQNYLNNAKVIEHAKPPIGVISPHAGYIYSGQAAAWTYKQLIQYEYSRAIVIAPSHRGKFSGVSVFPGNAYETPFGEIRIDKDFCAELAKHKTLCTYDKAADETEHSLEVQLPFLQIALTEFKLVPILMNDQRLENCKKLADVLVKICKAKPQKTVFVASSDLYHGPGIDSCNQMDEKLIDYLEEFNPEKFNKKSCDMEIMSCGYGPITTIMLAAKQLGARRFRKIYHTNSAEAAGSSEDYVVGYLSATIS